MASTIAALTSGAGGISMTGDASGILNLNSNGTNVVAVSSTGMAVTGTLAATGAVSGTTGTFTSTLGVTGAITGSSTVAGSTGILYPLTSGTAVASTSGTAIDFTSIPSWVKRVTVMFSGVSANGASALLVQLGTGSTTFTTSGYLAVASYGDTTTNFVSSTAGFPIFQNNAVQVFSGTTTITNISGNNWVAIHSGANGTSFSNNGGGNVALAAALTAVRITKVTGTETFDAGSVNILYE